MEKFHGEFSELETLVSDLGYKGQWVDNNGKKVFRSEDKASLQKGHVEVPSDANRIIYHSFNNHVKETAPKLCQRLREAGFELDPNAKVSA